MVAPSFTHSIRSETVLMSLSLSVRRGGRLAALMGAVLLVAACAGNKQQAGLDALGGMGGVGAPGAATPGSAQDFAVNVGDRVFFETDSSALTGTAQATLAQQAQWLATYPRYTIIVEGHADERGTREYNLGLGARRATAVRDYLASRGVAPTRIRTISYGKERPIAVCNDDSCWSQNRRGVTVLENVGS
jgi:peptidoglycan-associated lipoprotein